MEVPRKNRSAGSPRNGTDRTDADAAFGTVHKSRFDSVDHVAIAVRDADIAKSYFEDRYGVSATHDEVLDAIAVRLVYLDAGNLSLQLVQPLGPGPISEFLSKNGEGLHHVCFRVPDIDLTLAELSGDSAASIFRGGRNRRACFLREEPFGTRIELTEEREIE